MGISKEWRFVWYICGLFGGLLFKKDNARQLIGSVAQLYRALDFGSSGCRLESCRSHYNRVRVNLESDELHSVIFALIRLIVKVILRNHAINRMANHHKNIVPLVLLQFS